MSSTDPADVLRQPTSPLRIPKRDHAAALARRTSSSYRHVRNSQLVSNSPFKSIIPTPSPRRVSGEKRPRPLSMVDQADAERTFAYKRERRQSKGFQGLIQKEPVTKSPFKRRPSVDSLPATLPSTSQLATAYIHSMPPEPYANEPIAFPTDPEQPTVPSHATASPTRSSLVSHRMVGPRASGSSRDSLGGRRRRRKTVTFHEECDVVEYEPDEDSDPILEHNGVPEDDGLFGDPDQHSDHEQPDDSYEDIALSPDNSLTIESLLQATQQSARTSSPSALHDSKLAFTLPSPIHSTTPSPPSRADSLQYDDDEGSSSYEGQLDLNSIESILQTSFANRPESDPPATPPSRVILPHHQATDSKIPVRKSTHSDRLRATPQPTNTEAEIDQAARMLPPSPSPVKTRNRTVTNPDVPQLRRIGSFYR